MEQWKKNLYVLWVGTFIAAISFSLVTPFLPLFLKTALGVKHNLVIWSGIAFSSSLISSAVLSPVWGALADKYGRKIMIIRSGLGIGLVYIISAFVHNLYLFIFLRILMGVLSGFIPSSTALVATNTPEDKLSHSLGILQTGIAAGTIMGPLFGGLLSHFFGIRESIFIGGITILLGTILVIFGVTETAPRSTEKTNVIRDLKIGVSNKAFLQVLLILMIVQVALSMIQPILPLYIEKITPNILDVSLATGIVISLVGVASIIAAPRWADFGEKIGFKRNLIIGLFAGAMFNLLQLVFPNLYCFGGMRFLFGLSIAGVIPSVNALIAKSVDPDFRGRAFGISSSFNQLGQAAGPMIGGFVSKISGLGAPFVVGSLICLLAVTLLRKEEREAKQAKAADWPDMHIQH